MTATLRFFWFAHILALASCTRITNEVNIQSNGRLMLIDSTAFAGGVLDPDTSGPLAILPIYYVGAISDTIRLPRRPVRIFNSSERYALYDTTRRWTKFNEKNLSLVVDTTLALRFRPADTLTYQYRKAFALFMTNHSDSLIEVGLHSFLKWTTREALAPDGRWVEIDKETGDYCSIGWDHVILEPRQTAIAKVSLHSHGVETLCRLRFHRIFADYHPAPIYSNTFKDFVDPARLGR